MGGGELQYIVSKYMIWTNVNVVHIVHRLKEVLLNYFPGPPRHIKISAVCISEYTILSKCTNSLVPVAARSKA
jgi:hypothetical protein